MLAISVIAYVITQFILAALLAKAFSRPFSPTIPFFLGSCIWFLFWEMFGLGWLLFAFAGLGLALATPLALRNSPANAARRAAKEINPRLKLTDPEQWT